MDGTVQLGDLMDLQFDHDTAIIDPQLFRQYLGNPRTMQSDFVAIDSTLWQTRINTSQCFDTVQLPGFRPEDLNDRIDLNSGAACPLHEARTRAEKVNYTGNKLSVPCLVSNPSGSPTSRPSKHGPPLQVTIKRESKLAYKKLEANERSTAGKEYAGEYSKRNKTLQRNRIAASRCRQQKKAWVNELETLQKELEHRHNSLQQEYTFLVNNVTQLKNQLMEHASCNDIRIDGWIKTEAIRFVGSM